jgi:ABC-type polar amino acid transport system ATPase subunit
MTLIKVRDFNVSYKGAPSPTLHDINFTLEKGSITLFIGRSGSGKTSLLKCLAHLNTEYTGTIEYEGMNLKTLMPQERACAISYVAQHFNLFAHFTVFQNCIHPQIKVLKRTKEEAEKRAMKILSKLEIDHLADKKPHLLSGGQQQRIAIVRALCMGSQALLLDEPTSALDPKTTRELQELLLSLQGNGMTLVIITHDMPFAKGLTDTIHYLENGKITETHNKKTILSKNQSIYQFINQ